MIARASNSPIAQSAELLSGLSRNPRKIFRIQRGKIGCILVLICMPAGLGLDWFMYPGHLVSFFIFGRLLCDLAVLPLYLILPQSSGLQEIKFTPSASFGRCSRPPRFPG